MIKTASFPPYIGNKEHHDHNEHHDPHYRCDINAGQDHRNDRDSH